MSAAILSVERRITLVAEMSGKITPVAGLLCEGPADGSKLRAVDLAVDLHHPDVAVPERSCVCHSTQHGTSLRKTTLTK